MSGHTPGPWVLEELSSIKDGDGYILTEGSRVTVAHHGGAYSLGLSREEVLANAALIAAAPDLLKALERIASLRGSNGGIHNEMALDAIAKAEGGGS